MESLFLLHQGFGFRPQNNPRRPFLIVADMHCFSASTFCAVLMVGFIAAAGSSNVPAAIRLPSDAGDGDAVCPGFLKPQSCPVNCFRTEPVCGVNGVTYWCGCADAMCAGVRVAKLGFCEVGSAGSASLPGQALLLVHIVWLILLGFSVLCGLF